MSEIQKSLESNKIPSQEVPKSIDEENRTNQLNTIQGLEKYDIPRETWTELTKKFPHAQIDKQGRVMDWSNILLDLNKFPRENTSLIQKLTVFGEKTSESYGQKTPENYGQKAPENYNSLGEKPNESYGQKAPESYGQKTPENYGQKIPESYGEKI